MCAGWWRWLGATWVNCLLLMFVLLESFSSSVTVLQKDEEYQQDIVKWGIFFTSIDVRECLVYSKLNLPDNDRPEASPRSDGRGGKKDNFEHAQFMVISDEEMENDNT